MEVPKQIPQLFYDLIGKIIPGVVALCFFTFGTGTGIGELPRMLFAGSYALQNSVFTLLSVAVLTSYVLGHIISMVSDTFEKKLARFLVPKSYNILNQSISSESRYPQKIKDFLVREVGNGQKEKEKVGVMIFIWYDWLKVHSPDAGARSAKVRAEYRMHSGISVVMVATILIQLLFFIAFDDQLELFLLAVSAILAVLFLLGHARLRKMFEWSVINQYYAAKSGADKSSLT